MGKYRPGFPSEKRELKYEFNVRLGGASATIKINVIPQEEGIIENAAENKKT